MHCTDYIPQGTAVTAHRVTMENALNTPIMTAEEWRAMFDPIHQELVVRTKSETVYLDHAKFDPCPNCGANDWRAHFRTINPIESKLDHYTCAYCGTRKEE